jgi:hypothetical protein
VRHLHGGCWRGGKEQIWLHPCCSLYWRSCLSTDAVGSGLSCQPLPASLRNRTHAFKHRQLNASVSLLTSDGVKISASIPFTAAPKPAHVLPTSCNGNRCGMARSAVHAAHAPSKIAGMDADGGYHGMTWRRHRLVRARRACRINWRCQGSRLAPSCPPLRFTYKRIGKLVCVPSTMHVSGAWTGL